MIDRPEPLSPLEVALNERDAALAKYEHVMGLLRDTQMEHGLCQPRSRKACTACNAKEILEKLIAEWPGFTMVLS